MTFVTCCRLAALAIASLALAALSPMPAHRAAAQEVPAHRAAAQETAADGGRIAVLAKTSVKRPARRSRGRAVVRRSKARPQSSAAAASDIVPIPRPKPEGDAATALPAAPGSPAAGAASAGESASAAAAGDAGADAGAPNTQPAARPAATALVLPKNPAAARAELRALYSVNALSYRCNFELTTREGAVLDRAVTELETALKLDTQQADALFSDVDLGLYGNGGGRLCQKDGSGAKSFRATLDRLLGQ